MIRINENYPGRSPRTCSAKWPAAWRRSRKRIPTGQIIRLGIGDVTLPLTPTVLAAFHAAVEEMGSAATFHGYGPDLGYDFLRAAVADIGLPRARGRHQP